MKHGQSNPVIGGGMLKVNPADIGDGDKKISYIKEKRSHLKPDCAVPM